MFNFDWEEWDRLYPLDSYRHSRYHPHTPNHAPFTKATRMPKAPVEPVTHISHGGTVYDVPAYIVAKVDEAIAHGSMCIQMLGNGFSYSLESFRARKEMRQLSPDHFIQPRAGVYLVPPGWTPGDDPSTIRWVIGYDTWTAEQIEQFRPDVHFLFKWPWARDYTVQVRANGAIQIGCKTHTAREWVGRVGRTIHSGYIGPMPDGAQPITICTCPRSEPGFEAIARENGWAAKAYESYIGTLYLVATHIPTKIAEVEAETAAIFAKMGISLETVQDDLPSIVLGVETSAVPVG